jgi:aerobic carbon-monoxide dehydrogenase large subunit
VPHVGSSPKRADDPRILTGRGRYVDDFAPARSVHVAIVRSPHAHARITGMRLDGVRRAAGVAAVLTGEDTQKLCAPCRGILMHYTGMKTGAMLPLAVERVRYAGEPVVAIAGESRALAEDAAALVRVDYDLLPAVLSPEAAVAPGAPSIHPELGDNVIYETRLAGGDAARGRASGAGASRRGATRASPWSRAACWRTSSRPRAASPCGCRHRCRT